MKPHEFADVEHRIRRAYNADGMIETLLGLVLIAAGLGLTTKSTTVATGFFAIVVALAVSWRRRITYPRLGYARGFNARDRRRGIVVTVLLALLALVASAGSGLKNDHGTPWIDTHDQLVVGGLVGCAVAAVAAGRRTPYLYGVAAVLFCLIAAAFRVHLTAGYPIVFVGCVLFAGGIIRLILFLRANPVVPGTADPV